MAPGAVVLGRRWIRCASLGACTLEVHWFGCGSAGRWSCTANSGGFLLAGDGILAGTGSVVVPREVVSHGGNTDEVFRALKPERAMAASLHRRTGWPTIAVWPGVILGRHMSLNRLNRMSGAVRTEAGAL